MPVKDSYDPVEHYEAARSNEGRLPPKEADHEGFVMQESDAWNAEALASKAGLSLTRTQLAVAG